MCCSKFDLKFFLRQPFHDGSFQNWVSFPFGWGHEQIQQIGNDHLLISSARSGSNDEKSQLHELPQSRVRNISLIKFDRLGLLAAVQVQRQNYHWQNWKLSSLASDMKLGNSTHKSKHKNRIFTNHYWCTTELDLKLIIRWWENGNIDKIHSSLTEPMVAVK